MTNIQHFAEIDGCRGYWNTGEPGTLVLDGTGTFVDRLDSGGAGTGTLIDTSPLLPVDANDKPLASGLVGVMPAVYSSGGAQGLLYTMPSEQAADQPKTFVVVEVRSADNTGNVSFMQERWGSTSDECSINRSGANCTTTWK